MQGLIEQLQKRKREALEQIALFLLEEKKFYNLASDSSKGMSYAQLKELDFEDYYRYKAIVHNCDLLIKSVNDSKNLTKHLEIFNGIISKHTRYPFQSANPILTHQKLIENSVRQELYDFFKDWVTNNLKKGNANGNDKKSC